MQPKFKITHTITREDGGGDMTITAFTPEDKVSLAGHFNIDTMEMVDALKTGDPWTITRQGRGRDNSSFFLCSGKIDRSYIDPYINLLEKKVGHCFGGTFPSITSEFMYPRWNSLLYTHYLVDVHTEGGDLFFSTIVERGDWNHKTALQRAVQAAPDSIEDSLGEHVNNPEYIVVYNGGITGVPLYAKNPRYPGIIKKKAAACQQWFMDILVDYWLDSVATRKQKELVATSHDLNFSNHHGVSDLHNVKGYGGLRISWNDPEIAWEKFMDF